jgi:hypothetical protein
MTKDASQKQYLVVASWPLAVQQLVSKCRVHGCKLRWVARHRAQPTDHSDNVTIHSGCWRAEGDGCHGSTGVWSHTCRCNGNGYSADTVTQPPKSHETRFSGKQMVKGKDVHWQGCKRQCLTRDLHQLRSGYGKASTEVLHDVACAFKQVSRPAPMDVSYNSSWSQKLLQCSPR